MSLVATPKVLVDAAYAGNSDATVYTVPASTTTIIDKFTATTTDTGSLNLSVNLVKAGGSVSAANLIIDALSIATTATKDFTELQNQILAAGDFISVKAGTASKIVVRVSGRECK